MSEAMPEVLFRYFEAWRTHNCQEISRLFVDNATYDIIGSRVLVGLEEIKKYWEHIRQTQRDVIWSVSRFERNDESIIACWSAEFFRVDRNEQFYVDGILWLTLKAEKIAKLIECYRTTIKNQARIGK